MDTVRIYHVENTFAALKANARRAAWTYATDLDYGVYFVGTDKTERHILCANTTNGLINVMSSITMSTTAGWIGASATRARFQWNALNSITLKNGNFGVDGSTILYNSLSINKNSGDNPITPIAMTNTYNPGSGETGSGIRLDFQVRGTQDSEASYQTITAGRMSFEKVTGFNGGGVSSYIGAFGFYLYSASLGLVQSCRMKPNSFLINAGGNVTNFETGAPLHVKYANSNVFTLNTNTLAVFSSLASTSIAVTAADTDDKYEASLYLGDRTTPYDNGGIIYANNSDEMNLQTGGTKRIKIDSTGVRIQPAGVSTASVTALDIIQGSPSSISASSVAGAMLLGQNDSVFSIRARGGQNSIIYLGNYNNEDVGGILYNHTYNYLNFITTDTSQVLATSYGLAVKYNAGIADRNLARLNVEQQVNDVKPVLRLKQNNATEEVIHIDALSGGVTGGLVQFGDSATADSWTLKGWIKHQIKDSNSTIQNRTDYYVPFFTVSANGDRYSASADNLYTLTTREEYLYPSVACTVNLSANDPIGTGYFISRRNEVSINGIHGAKIIDGITTSVTIASSSQGFSGVTSYDLIYAKKATATVWLLNLLS